MQTHPWAPEFSRLISQLISYGVLANVSSCCPPLKGRFSTHYSPVRHCPLPEGNFSFDLHVWSTPPAFVLSQDQTLHCQKVILFNLLGCLAHYFFVLIISFFRINKVFCLFSYSVVKVLVLNLQPFFELCNADTIFWLGFTSFILYQMH